MMNSELFVPNITALCQLHRVCFWHQKDGTVHAVGILKMDLIFAYNTDDRLQ